MKNNSWNGNNRRKYLLQYHVIFVCKYRKRLLASKSIALDIKRLSQEICNKHHVLIRYMETDQDHIHFMIETDTTKSLSDIICMMKSYTAYHIWKLHPAYLKEYIENQG